MPHPHPAPPPLFGKVMILACNPTCLLAPPVTYIVSSVTVVDTALVSVAELLPFPVFLCPWYGCFDGHGSF